MIRTFVGGIRTCWHGYPAVMETSPVMCLSAGDLDVTDVADVLFGADEPSAVVGEQAL